MPQPIKFLLVDTLNTLMRAFHATSGNIFDKTGLALDITIKSVSWAFKKFNCDNVIFCLEGQNNWRKSVYPLYKANRAVQNIDKSQKDIDEETFFWNAVNDFTNFIETKTNTVVLKANRCEADDFIARFIQIFSEEQGNEFVILSSDNDFIQLIRENVQLYDGMSKKLYRVDGVYDEKMNPVLDKKTNQHVVINPEYALFEKCIRGDSSDNVPSAYPGVRKDGTAKKIGIIEAFSDRLNEGYAYVNFFNTEWKDQDNITHKVKTDYLRNKQLIDLTQQPKEIIELLDKTILQLCQEERNRKSIMFDFLKFTAKHELKRLSENCDDVVKMFSKEFKL